MNHPLATINLLSNLSPLSPESIIKYRRSPIAEDTFASGLPQKLCLAQF